MSTKGLRTTLKDPIRNYKRKGYLTTPNKWDNEIGSTEQVGNETAFRTRGWLTRVDLKKNKQGRWVSIAKSNAGKRIKAQGIGMWKKET